MLHYKFHGNRPAGSGEEIFEGFLPYMGFVAILVMSSDFHFLVPESFKQKLVQIGTEVSKKIQYEFLYLHTLYLKALKKDWFRSAQKFLRNSSLNFCIYTPWAKVKKLP